MREYGEKEVVRFFWGWGVGVGKEWGRGEEREGGREGNFGWAESGILKAGVTYTLLTLFDHCFFCFGSFSISFSVSSREK